MKELYLSEVRRELAKYSSYPNEVITEDDISLLPEPVQKYFRYCRHIGQEKMVNAKVEWKDVFLKMAPDKKWMDLKCYQFNSVPEPTRIAYMRNRLFGILPFEGMDKYQVGYGNMRIKLLKIFQVADAKGKEMDASALVTVLAESLLVPTYALQPYINWTAIDSNTAKAVIKYNQCEVSGFFFFNDRGEYIRFETNDRYFSEKGSEYKRVKWSGVVENYREKNGMKFPSHFKAVWHLDEGDYEYFKGTITDIKFNISKTFV
ncbi:DUF6544 family protein [Desulfitibacter alkalitolerans]|uniref:DUF6544 family protein n=1 Tax=Desulfitibacter alkalitolerans TaxID=264641 RepID=UPI000683DE8C|nr:DUF6544 family protein [Desulfitibacter alkalitolerans]